MGAFYLVVCPSRRQYLNAHRFGDGLQLLEQGASGSGTMMGLAVLLADGNGRGNGDLRSSSPLIGSWAGRGVVLASDYADEGRFVSTEDMGEWRQLMAQNAEYMLYLNQRSRALGDVEPNLYHVAKALYEDISDKVILALCDDPYERQALIERGAEAAKAWVEPKIEDPFKLE